MSENTDPNQAKPTMPEDDNPQKTAGDQHSPDSPSTASSANEANSDQGHQQNATAQEDDQKPNEQAPSAADPISESMTSQDSKHDVEPSIETSADQEQPAETNNAGEVAERMQDIEAEDMSAPPTGPSSTQDNNGTQGAKRLFGTGPRCQAKAKSTGVQCNNLAVRGYRVCRMHGANPKNRGGNPRLHLDREERVARINSPEALAKRSEAMQDNKLAVLHGACSKKILTDNEQQIYEWTKEILRDEYKLDFAADEILLDELAILNAKRESAHRGGAAESTKTSVRGAVASLLRQLNIRRDKRGETGGRQSPQELLAEMVQRIKITQTTVEIEAQATGQLPAAKVIDVEELPAKAPLPAAMPKKTEKACDNTQTGKGQT